MKISKLWEREDFRILTFCLIIFVLFGLSFAGLGAVSFFSLWLLVRWLPIGFLFIFFFDAVKAFSDVRASKTKREKYANIAIGLLEIVMCLGLLFVMSLPN